MSANIWQVGQVPLQDAQNTMASERIIATAGQQTLVLTAFEYVLGASSIIAFKNGQVMYPTIDFTEFSTSQITLTQPAAAGDVFLVVGFIRVFDATATVESIFTDLSAMYLGAQATDPTADALGNAVITGALYFNTTTGLRVKTASGWQTAGIPITGTLLASNNLSDLANLVTARQNLGVRIYTVDVALSNDLSKKASFANAAALVGAKILASIIAVSSGDSLNDELEFVELNVYANCVANGTVNIFLSSSAQHTGTYTICYLIQN